MNVVELFCGAGGTSLGFQRAGFSVRAGLDISESAMKTFSRNFPGAGALCRDVQEVSGLDLLAAADIAHVDVLLGGPSCQGYSTMGHRIEDDPRNFLFTHYIRLVSELKPTWIFFENVRGMMLYGKGRFIRTLADALAEIGYSCCYSVLNAADYGVPQRRERFFLIGTRRGFHPTFPSPTHEDPRCRSCARPDKSKRVRKSSPEAGGLFPQMPCCRCGGSGLEPASQLKAKPWVSVWDAIGDLALIGDCGGTMDFRSYDQPGFSPYQKLMRSSSKGYDLHYAKPISPLSLEIVAKVPEGAGLRSIPDDELPNRFRVMRKIGNGKLRRDCTTLYYRLSRTLPSYTITCSFTNVASGAFVHPLSNRAITPREAARLQSFPDSFKFHPTHLKMQIGNAVPPILAEVLAKHILRMESFGTDSKKESATNRNERQQRSEPAELEKCA